MIFSGVPDDLSEVPDVLSGVPYDLSGVPDDLSRVTDDLSGVADDFLIQNYDKIQKETINLHNFVISNDNCKKQTPLPVLLTVII